MSLGHFGDEYLPNKDLTRCWPRLGVLLTNLMSKSIFRIIRQRNSLTFGLCEDDEHELCGNADRLLTHDEALHHNDRTEDFLAPQFICRAHTFDDSRRKEVSMNGMLLV
jgi:hypothetical protein